MPKSIAYFVEKNPEFESKGIFLSKSIEYLFMIVGTMLALVRITEPYFWKHFVYDTKRLLTKIFCVCSRKGKITKERRGKFSDEPLCAFATSAMNIEFVYLILLGVNNFMNNQQL